MPAGKSNDADEPVVGLPPLPLGHGPPAESPLDALGDTAHVQVSVPPEGQVALGVKEIGAVVVAVASAGRVTSSRQLSTSSALPALGGVDGAVALHGTVAEVAVAPSLADAKDASRYGTGPT